MPRLESIIFNLGCWRTKAVIKRLLISSRASLRRPQARAANRTVHAQRMFDCDEAFVLDVIVPCTERVLSFIPAARTVADMIWKV